ncbi:hypothetical protein [Actibacterium sp. D379-3]
MKTLCFLDRMELTDLCGPVSQVMPEDILCLHLAYDAPEAEKLAAMGIADVPVFKQLLPAFLKDMPPDAARLAEIELWIVAATQGAFGLNSDIQSDRAMQGIAYTDCLRLADAYLAFWQDFVEKHQINHLLHETVSLLFNFMAERGGSYLFCIMSQAEPGSYRFMVMEGDELFSPDITRALALPAGARGAEGYTRDDLRAFLEGFRNSIATVFGGAVTQSVAWHRLTDDILERLLPPWSGGMRRQDLPNAYVLNGAIYLRRVADFAKTGQLVTGSTIGYDLAREHAVDIDTLEDFARAEALIAARTGEHTL